MQAIPIGGRRFQVWHYSPSHRLLLPMSPKDDGLPSRFCILFVLTTHLDLPTLLNITDIRFETDPGNEQQHFDLVCAAGTYAVQAAAMFTEEDNLEYTEEHLLDRWLSLKSDQADRAVREYC